MPSEENLSAKPPKRTNRGRRFPPEVLSDAEVRRLMAACSAGPMGVRNRALIAVLYRTGLRISEALALRPKDVDLHAGAVRVLHGKGNRSRLVGVDPDAGAVLTEWLQVRAGLGIDGTWPVFCQRDGTPLESSYIRVMLPRLGRRAGIEKRVHAHGLRRAHASSLREEGLDIGLISKRLGHRNIATTARYLDHIAPLAVVNAIRQRQWG